MVIVIAFVNKQTANNQIMKNWFLLLPFLLLCALTSAQEIDRNPEWQNKGDWVFAPYVGLTTSTIYEGNFIDDDNISGNSFLLGIQADYFFKDNWSVKAKFNYENRDFGTGSSEFLNLTITPVWHFGKNRRWHLQLGAAYSAFLDDSIADGAFETDLGIGVIIPIGSHRFFIELDGVTDNNAFEVNITDMNGSVISTTTFRTNRSSINFGYLF